MRKTRLGRIVLGVLALVLFVVGWFGVNRLAGGWHAVRIRQVEGGGTIGRAIDPAGGLRIGAYNIAHGRGPGESNWSGGDSAARLDRLQRIGALLAEANLDVAVLNEVDFDSVWSGHRNQAEVTARAAGFPYWAEQRNVDVAVPFCSLRFGNVVMSKYPISDARLVEYPQGSGFLSLLGAPRNGMVCRIRTGADQSIRVLAVHLDPGKCDIRLGSVLPILGIQQEDAAPLFLAGDFNAPRDLEANGKATCVARLIETGRWSTLPNAAPAAAELTYPSDQPRSVIDWVLVPKPWTIVERRVVRTDLSDHLPVFVHAVSRRALSPSSRGDM